MNWVDLAILVLLVVGFVRGRKRGMSQELLDMFKWVVVLVLAGFVYEPAGRLLAQTTFFGLLFSYIAVYTLIMLAVLFGFHLIKSAAGDKLVSSDFFGSAEYYLGMGAGAFRYACVILVFMAFLNSRYFTPQELQAQRRFQQDNFGSTYFPTLATVQSQVFSHSLTGRAVHEHLDVILIRGTSPQENGRGSAFSRRRQKRLNDVLAN